MPDELYILFICDDKEIMVHDCPFEHILVRDIDEKTIHGRCIADNAIGDDSSVVGQACLFYEHQSKTVFYHNNPYFSTTTVSDDDEFLGRVTLPF